MNLAKLICSSIAISPLFATAQVLTGTVIDASGKPIEFANVILLDSAMHFSTGSVTSANGSFVIPFAKKQLSGYVVASSVGMNPDTIPLNANTQLPLSITLTAKTTVLGEVIVKGTRSLFKNEQDVITANVQNTILAKAGSLDNLMNQIPFVSGGGGEYNTRVRDKNWLEQCKLRCFHNMYLQRSRLIVKEAVCRKCPAKVNDEIVYGSVS